VTRAAEKVGDDDDVEGHGVTRAPQRGVTRAAEKVGDDDDVEGHKHKS
jgi:hypothetical protein